MSRNEIKRRVRISVLLTQCLVYRNRERRAGNIAEQASAVYSLRLCQNALLAIRENQ